MVQAWELQQFVRSVFYLIKWGFFGRGQLIFIARDQATRDWGFYSLLLSHTSAGADVVILAGDLNMHPQDLGNRLLRTSTGLRDSYAEAAKFDVGSRVDAVDHSSTKSKIYKHISNWGNWNNLIQPAVKTWYPSTQNLSPELIDKVVKLKNFHELPCRFNKLCHTGSKQMDGLTKCFVIHWKKQTKHLPEFWFDPFLKTQFEWMCIEVVLFKYQSGTWLYIWNVILTNSQKRWWTDGRSVSPKKKKKCVRCFSIKCIFEGFLCAGSVQLSQCEHIKQVWNVKC